jgi:hypothetical protein
MVLDSTTKSLQVVLAATPATTQLPCVTSWADMTTSTFLPGSTDIATNGTTAATLVAAPAASTQRQVKVISIYNADTAVATVTVRLNNNATLRTIVSVTLKVGQTLQFAENAWSVIDSAGSLQESGGSSATAAGSDSQVQFNNGGALGGDPNLTWNDTSQIMTLGGTMPAVQIAGSVSGAPTTSGTSYMGVFGRTVANRQMLAQASTYDHTAMQPFLARNKIGYWNPSGNSTTVPGVFGFLAPVLSGTTSRSTSATNLATRMRRMGFVTAATAGSLAYCYLNTSQFSCGSGSNDGSGFFYVVRWVPSDAAVVAGERNFVGISNTTSTPTNVEPSSVSTQIGVAQLSTDATQLYLTYGGSTPQTPIALGANFPASTLSTVAYELAIYAPNTVSNTYYYQVTNITTGNVATGTLSGNSTQVPQNSTMLAPRNWTTNNATALATGLDICSMYIETDN